MNNETLGLPGVYKRVGIWNDRRYPRILNITLLCKLLREELKEWYDSEQEVHQLDAICDIIYVALGGLWKSNTDEQMQHDMQFGHSLCFDLMRANALGPMYLISGVIDAIEHDADFPATVGAFAIIHLALIEAQTTLNLSLEQVYEACFIVCDSNDTKSVPKDTVDPSVKANIDKGHFFVAPEPRLNALLEKRHG